MSNQLTDTGGVGGSVLGGGGGTVNPFISDRGSTEIYIAHIIVLIGIRNGTTVSLHKKPTVPPPNMEVQTNQCCRSGSGRIRNLHQDPNPEKIIPDPSGSGSEMGLK